jgi:hypothetical protein
MRYFGWRGQRLQDSDSPVYRAYLVRLASLVDGLLDDGCEVQLVHGENGDVEAMDEILTGLEQIGRHSALEVDRTEATTFEELLTVVGGFDLLVATRFTTWWLDCGRVLVHRAALSSRSPQPSVRISPTWLLGSEPGTGTVPLARDAGGRGTSDGNPNRIVSQGETIEGPVTGGEESPYCSSHRGAVVHRGHRGGSRFC